MTTCISCEKLFSSRGSEYCETCEASFEPEKYDAECIFNKLVDDLDSCVPNEGTTAVIAHLHVVMGEWLHRVKGGK